jgi:hypothetical protein
LLLHLTTRVAPPVMAFLESARTTAVLMGRCLVMASWTTASSLWFSTS